MRPEEQVVGGAVEADSRGVAPIRKKLPIWIFQRQVFQYSFYGMGYIHYNVLPKGEFSGFLDQEDSGCHSLQAPRPSLGNIV
ncbi:hypothetical protein HGM15179_020959 [Zosterops borbonicus]|uniref:Uncharacterized protein n=1 Tax=Zosterops borbonicus TaxID=364589 RepID=A0A8K1D889_9PASS|nr:hypothetical protein HGM15179_020959 [Zosterops borbonicus]